MLDFTLLNAVAEPWLNENAAIYVGAYGGAGIGTVCGVIGAMAGVLAPRGKGKGLVVGSMLTIGLLGLCCLTFAIIAAIMGQPGFVWMPFGLLGFVSSSVCLPLVPVIKQRYREAEQRQIEAQALRRS
ncbi:MAG: hypothetical protein H8E15_08715 [Planctomycetes bacterium]|nr:hypothetical protein [Planctomycetota bacterium]